MHARIRVVSASNLPRRVTQSLGDRSSMVTRLALILIFTPTFTAQFLQANDTEWKDRLERVSEPPPPSIAPLGVVAPFGNTCADGGDLGMLVATGGTLSGDTSAGTNDYGDTNDPSGLTDGRLGVCNAPDWRHSFGTGPDVIASFTVDSTGPWTFTTCPRFSDPGSGGPAGGFSFNSSLMILEGNGSGCPGSAMVACDGDGRKAECPGRESDIHNVNLNAGTPYYLLVDGKFPSANGPFTVAYHGPCISDQDCTDREGDLFCTGVEACTGDRTCTFTGNPCLGTADSVCDEEARQCVVCDEASDPAAACGDDGFECNGVERCDLDAGRCVVDPPCGGRPSKCRTGQCGDGSGTPCDFDFECDGDGDGVPDAQCVIDESTATCEDADACLVYWNDGGFFIWRSSAFQEMVADDIILRDVGNNHAGRDLISYEIVTLCREGTTNLPVTGPYDVTIQLWTALDTDPYTDPSAGLPDAPIPGTACTFKDIPCGVGGPVGTPGRTTSHTLRCAPNGGLPSGIILPESTLADTDLWLTYTASAPVAGIASTWLPQPIVGSSRYSCLARDKGTGGLSWFDGCGFAGIDIGFADIKICTQVVGPCCVGVAGCEMLTEDDCVDQGGRFIGRNTALTPDNTCDESGDTDGVAVLCDNCPDVDNADQGDCDKDGEGDACESDENDQDRDFDGMCNGVDPCPDDPEKGSPAGNSLGGAPGHCGCGCPDDDVDGDGFADCMFGKEGECCSRADGCPTSDLCPNDPNKIAPGQCGCGRADEGDTDGDGVLDCADLCPGIDDAVFAPECAVAIPAASAWGMVVLGLLLLVWAKVCFARRRQTHL